MPPYRLYRAVWKLGFDQTGESIVSAIIDLGSMAFSPEGALADAFERYHVAPDDRALDGPASMEWRACHVIDSWVRRLLQGGAVGPLGHWRPRGEARSGPRP